MMDARFDDGFVSSICISAIFGLRIGRDAPWVGQACRLRIFVVSALSGLSRWSSARGGIVDDRLIKFIFLGEKNA